MNRIIRSSIVLGALLAGSCLVPSDGACDTDAECIGGATCVEGLCVGGDVPTASIAAPPEVELDALVSLDGTGSRTAAGTAEGLAYVWKLLEAPGVSIEGETSPTAKLRATKPHGVYKVQLTVTDKGTPSEPVVKEIRVANSKPVARLESDPTTWLRLASIALNAGTSTDADTDALTYEWALEKDPASAVGTVTAGENGTATLQTGATAAKYKVTVTVSDGTLSEKAVLEQLLENAPPQLDAGAAAELVHACVGTGGTKSCRADGTLTGTATDVDGTITAGTIAWKLKSAPAASHAVATLTPTSDPLVVNFRLSNASTDPLVGDYEFELTATDNDGVSATDTVVITIKNAAPTLSLGAAGPRSVGHTFASGSYSATVVVDAVVTDPEADDFTVTFEPITTTLPGATPTVTVATSGLKATCVIKVLAANPTSLINGTTPLYTVNVRVTDVNGAESTLALPILITNRPATLTGLADLTLTGHSYNATKGYVGEFTIPAAIPPAVLASDLDGDPLTITWTAAPTTPAKLPAAALTFKANGPLDAPTGFSVSSLDPDVVSDSVKVTGTVKDAFAAPMAVTKTLQLGNRLPTIITTSWQGLLTATSASAGASSCVNTCNSICTVENRGRAVAFGVVPGAHQVTLNAVATADPDGDPITLKYRVDIPRCPVGEICFPPKNGFIGAPAGEVSVANCTGTPCPKVTAPIGANACVAGALVPRSYVETDNIRVTPYDGIASGTGLTRPHAIAEGCSPSCN